MTGMSKVFGVDKETRLRKITARGVMPVKKEYDFSKGDRGKFYHPNVELNLPVYLDPDVAAVMRDLAQKKGIDIG